MRTGALVALIACPLVLAESARQTRVGGYVSASPSTKLNNINWLLIPLTVSDASHASGESGESGKDMPFSSIPSSAFILDEGPRAPSPKQDLAYRPRSVYLESIESDERSERGELDAGLRRACSRLARLPAGHEHELLLVLCDELLDLAPAPPAPPPAPAPPALAPRCSCGQHSAEPAWLQQAERSRRDLMPVGGDTDWVLSYMRSRK